MSDEPKEIVKKSRGAQNYDLLDGVNVLDVFVDGSSGTMIGPTVSKIVFHTVTGVTEEKGAVVEQRKVSLRLTIPTVVFLEFLAQSFESLSNAEKPLKNIRCLRRGREWRPFSCEFCRKECDLRNAARRWSPTKNIGRFFGNCRGTV